jgi:hypothetical protein
MLFLLLHALGDLLVIRAWRGEYLLAGGYKAKILV